MSAAYFFIDGSALMAQIRQLRRAKPIFKDRKLCPKLLIQSYVRNLSDLHDGSYKRATFYFANGDEYNVEEYFEVPDFANPGEIRDLNFKYCGSKLKKSQEFEKFVEEEVPDKFKSRFSKSEKGVDIEICCDAMKLASAGRMDRLLLLSNDGDFIPLCRTLKEFGSNISIIHLTRDVKPNRDLLLESDTYDVVRPDYLAEMFLPMPVQTEGAPADGGRNVEEAGSTEEMLAEKPDAAPSDLLTVSETIEPDEGN